MTYLGSQRVYYFIALFKLAMIGELPVSMPQCNQAKWQCSALKIPEAAKDTLVELKINTIPLLICDPLCCHF